MIFKKFFSKQKLEEIENMKKHDEIYKELKTKEEAEVFQRENYGEYCKCYKDIQQKMQKTVDFRCGGNKDGVEYYLGNYYRALNNYLMNDPEEYDLEEKIIDRNSMIESVNEKEMRNENTYKDIMIDNINRTIFSAPVIKENIVVFRAVGVKEMENINEKRKEFSDWYKFKKFLSTSLRKEVVYEKFPDRKDILKIYVPEGINALGVDGINDRGEEEILFPTGIAIKYIGEYKDKENDKNIYCFEMNKKL